MYGHLDRFEIRFHLARPVVPVLAAKSKAKGQRALGLCCQEVYISVNYSPFFGYTLPKLIKEKPRRVTYQPIVGRSHM